MTPDHTLAIPDESRPAVRDEPLGWFPTWIVGRAYYSTAAPAGVALVLARQPDNRFDSDAIAVFAPRGGQIGHLPRYDAACLAPLLDRGTIRLTARLAGPDAPTERAPLRLEVWPAERAVTLAGTTDGSFEAIWHSQVLALWQERVRFTPRALSDFRAAIRDLAHTGRLWPETQLFYRLLKGTVADGVAAEEQERLAAALLVRATEARRRADALACGPCGSLLPFGHLSVLPLRALRPAPVVTLCEALRAGTAALRWPARPGSGRLEVILGDGIRLLAVRGEVLDTSAGRFRLLDDTVIESAGIPRALRTVIDDEAARQRHMPVFLENHALATPSLPDLPESATGYAVFHGGRLLRISLFAHSACATSAAAEEIPRLPWHLRPSRPALSLKTAFDEVARIHSETPLTRQHDGSYRFEASAALKGRARLLDDQALFFLRVRAAPAFADKLSKRPCEDL